MVDGKKPPRWARSLGQEKWDELNELLHEGWDISDIMRRLDIPESNRRSLQLYARPFGPRRRLILFSRFADTLLSGGEKLGPDFVKALSLIAAKAVSPDVKESTQIRACELLVQFTQTLGKLTAADAKAEEERRREETDKTTMDPARMRRELLELYGIDPNKLRGGDGG